MFRIQIGEYHHVIIDKLMSILETAFRSRLDYSDITFLITHLTQIFLYLHFTKHRHFFFFQAEDGIRDWFVTGVQTCALPISRPNTAAMKRVALKANRRPTTSDMIPQ